VKNLSNNEDKEKLSLFINFGTVKDVAITEEILKKVKEFGKIVKARFYLEQGEMENYRDTITEISKLGLEPIVTILAKDVRLAIDMLDDAYDPNIDIIALVHDKEDIIPALLHVKTLKRIILVAPTRVPKGFYTVVEEVIEI